MTRHRMVVVLLEDVLPLDYAIPIHVFGREAPEAYDLVTVSVGGGPVPVAGGTTVVPDGGLELLRRAGTIVVPGYADAAGRELPGSLLRALAGAHRRGVRMVSICSGAFALARAGVLDGLTVTTHWSLCADLAERFPAVTVDQSVLVAGTGSVLTSGGVTAGVDLCLHLLNADLGPAAARHIARRIVMAPRPANGQQPFVEKAAVPPGDDVIAQAQQWMLVSLERPLSVKEVATRFALSERTFHRRFREKVGLPPLTWLRDQRIARAKELLEGTELSIEDVARRVGLGTAANLRVQFRSVTGVSPREHRKSFTFGA
ncbi:GlxA family transcriptional regulator [Amycolatopsis vancoresmycina]|uniref:AraC family transcriptional regulator n=1 Tax=Amycolatopsis vancoresmycina DSM 44592 TaxID=1292037 RepID=R1FVY7_9PSEU|nr:helix-turn-helix domain-containing protein [Amycolatopsis vancoresmycina]EOD63553.1 AraC family transcriptional regulator [Amycolatopsis vancoresmycina DSM 44592]